jgi:hypothetical protein
VGLRAPKNGIDIAAPRRWGSSHANRVLHPRRVRWILSAFARSICLDHRLCLVGILVFLALQLSAGGQQ